MRDAKYVTMIDPFTQKYGKWGSLQAFPSAISEIFWSASILGALGKTLRLKFDEKILRSYIRGSVYTTAHTWKGKLGILWP